LELYAKSGSPKKPAFPLIVDYQGGLFEGVESTAPYSLSRKQEPKPSPPAVFDSIKVTRGEGKKLTFPKERKRAGREEMSTTEYRDTASDYVSLTGHQNPKYRPDRRL